MLSPGCSAQAATPMPMTQPCPTKTKLPPLPPSGIPGLTGRCQVDDVTFANIDAPVTVWATEDLNHVPTLWPSLRDRSQGQNQPRMGAFTPLISPHSSPEPPNPQPPHQRLRVLPLCTSTPSSPDFAPPPQHVPPTPSPASSSPQSASSKAPPPFCMFPTPPCPVRTVPGAGHGVGGRAGLDPLPVV